MEGISWFIIIVSLPVLLWGVYPYFIGVGILHLSEMVDSISYREWI